MVFMSGVWEGLNTLIDFFLSSKKARYAKPDIAYELISQVCPWNRI